MSIDYVKKLMAVSICFGFIPADNDYVNFINELKIYAKKYSLDINLVVVTSSFETNNKTGIRYGLDIRILKFQENFEPEIYRQLAKLYGISKENSELKIISGYGLRSINPLDYSGTIVTGSHSIMKNEIMFDCSVYRAMGFDAMVLRFAHEILHEFGLNEDQVLEKEHEYYRRIKNFNILSMNRLFENLDNAYFDIALNIKKIFQKIILL